MDGAPATSPDVPQMWSASASRLQAHDRSFVQCVKTGATLPMRQRGLRMDRELEKHDFRRRREQKSVGFRFPSVFIRFLRAGRGVIDICCLAVCAPTADVTK